MYKKASIILKFTFTCWINTNTMSERKFYKVGITDAVPWSFKNEDGEWSGFCIDLIKILSEQMNFDYELILSEDNDQLQVQYQNGSSRWKGIVNDLITEKTDLAVAAFTMTAARTEVVDYVIPYFEKSGISIVIRKPIQAQQFFKFMTVLSVDVWISIVIAIFITAVVLWIIEKQAPGEGRVTSEKDHRKFTLKESMWFALTTFTSQGSGEIPMSCANRILIGSYWVFVLVMMSTFTANLAAFLTVERLQTQVSSLWELPRQKIIKFTVVENSHAHSYFKNMKKAEDKLFEVWKDIAINESTENETNYMVWDYPIREEYRQILYAIEKNNPVPNASYGIEKVLENKQGEFALIHDTAEIRYYYYRSCHLLEVGEIFGERPYTIAVRKGNKLKNKIRDRILDLQKDKYFDILSDKYWNASAIASCSADDDDENVTLDCLGGVFITVVFGVIIALVSLGSEVASAVKRKRTEITEYSFSRRARRANDEEALRKWTHYRSRQPYY